MATHRNENHRNDERGRRNNDVRRPEIRVPWARVTALLVGIGCWIRAAFVAAAGENNYTGTPWGEIWSLVGLGLVFIGFALFARWLMTTSWDRKARDLDSLLQNIVGIGLGFMVGGQNAAWMHQDANQARQTHSAARRERQRQAAKRAPQPQARPAARPRPAQLPPAQPTLTVDPRQIKLAAAAQVIAFVHERAVELSSQGRDYRLVGPSIEGLMSDLGRTLPVDHFRYSFNGVTVTGDECPNLVKAGRRAARQALLDLAGPSGMLYTPQNFQTIQMHWSERVKVLV